MARPFRTPKPKRSVAFAIAPISAWSFSRWSTYTECPAKARYKFVDKLPEPQHPAAARGEAIDKWAREFIEGKRSSLSAELVKLKAGFTRLRQGFKQRRVKAQLEIAVTREWKPTGWFSGDAWGRFKLDVLELVPAVKKQPALARVIDVKSGKLRTGDDTPYEDQLESYAVGALSTAVGAIVAPELWFTDHGVVMPSDRRPVVKLADLAKLQQRWTQLVTPMLSDTVFSPRPGSYCNYCHFRKDNNGPCVY